MTETKHTPTLDDFIEAVGSGDFYRDYDASTELLGAARRELSRLRNSHTALVAALTNARSTLTAFCGDPRQVIAEHGTRANNAMLAELFEQIDAALSAEGEKDAPKDDGWIDWKGGECPVEENAGVDLKFRDGHVSEYEPSGMWSWEWNSPFVEPDDEIVAYRRARR